MKTLFTNCTILLKDDKKYKVLNNAYLGVDGKEICYISEKKPKGKFDVIKDMTNKLLMAGLINAHTHSPMTLMRGYGTGYKLQDWLFGKIFPIEEKLTPEQIEIGCRMAICEMLSSGTVCFSEMYDFPFASCKAISEAGIKANVMRVGLCFDKNADMATHERFNECLDFVRTVNKFDKKDNPELERELKVKSLPDEIKDAVKDGRLKAELGIHSEYLTSPAFVEGIVKYNNEEFKGQLQCHISETLKETTVCIQNRGLTPLAYLNKFGFLEGGRAYLAHCVHFNDSDLELAEKTKSTMIYNPSSNMKLGSGFAPILKALKLGINVALGTDGCASNDNLDMFEEMHLAAMIQLGTSQDPTSISAETILDMATVNGAKAMGRPNSGILKVGYDADIIAIDLNKPHLMPMLDVPNLIVYAMHGSDVCMTMVNGKILYENGSYTTINYKETVEEFKKAVEQAFSHVKKSN